MKNLVKISLCSLQAFVASLHAYNADINYWYTDKDSEIELCAPQEVILGCGEFSVGGDWLYWKCEQDKMEFGAQISVETEDGVTSIESSIIKPKFKEHSGYRVYADYMTAAKDWKVLASFTHVPTSASVSIVENPLTMTMDFITLFGTNFPILSAIAGASFDSIDGRWHATVDYLDIDAARTISLCDTFQISPHVGLRGFWSDQKYTIDGAATGLSFISHLKQRMQGIGMEGGLWGNLQLCNGFSLIGHVGGGLIYTKFHNKGSLDGSIEDVPAHIQYSNTSHRSLAMVDTFIGLKYETCLSNLNVNAHIGWEQHIIFDVNQFSVEGGGNLTLQGLTLGGGFVF